MIATIGLARVTGESISFIGWCFMGYVVNFDKPTRQATVHKDECLYNIENRGIKATENGYWSESFTSKGDAISHAETEGRKLGITKVAFDSCPCCSPPPDTPES